MSEYPEKLYDRALNYLSFRPRSEKEVSDNLKKKSKSPEDIKEVLNRLKKAGLVDDSEFVSWWVAQRTKSSNPRGLRIIRMELSSKGVARDLWEDLQVDEYPLIQRSVEKKLRSLKEKDEMKRKKKLSEYLLRRGFSWNTVKEVLEDLE